jgi:hypothetical protein
MRARFKALAGIRVKIFINAIKTVHVRHATNPCRRVSNHPKLSATAKLDCNIRQTFMLAVDFIVGFEKLQPSFTRQKAVASEKLK